MSNNEHCLVHEQEQHYVCTVDKLNICKYHIYTVGYQTPATESQMERL